MSPRYSGYEWHYKADQQLRPLAAWRDDMSMVPRTYCGNEGKYAGWYGDVEARIILTLFSNVWRSLLLRVESM
jgi:hypothetical protein